MKMVKCLPEFEYSYCIYEKQKLYFQIRISKVTDYAALTVVIYIIKISSGDRKRSIIYQGMYEGCPSKSWTFAIT